MKTERIQLATLVLVSVLLYVQSLTNGFVWDDWLVHLDSSFKALSPAHILSFFSGKNPYPLSALSNALNYSLWGVNPMGYHASNIFLHTIVTVTVYFFLRCLFTPLPQNRVVPEARRSTKRARQGAVTGVPVGTTPFWCALVFAVHPVHSEPVAWISGHPDLLYTAFYMGALILGLRARLSLSFSYALSVLFFLFSMMAKPVAVTFPVVYLMLLVWVQKNAFKRSFLKALPYIGVAFFWLIYLRGSISSRLASVGAEAVDTLYPLRILPSVVAQYLRSWFWPTELSIHHDFAPHSLLNIGIALVLLVVIVAAVWAVRRGRWEGLGILWTAVTLSPMLNWPFTAASVYADRYLYLPSVGLALTSVVLVQKLFLRPNILLKRAWTVAVVMIFAFLLVFTVQYNRMWGDERLLYKQAIRTTQQMAYYFYNDLGTAYARRGQLREAEESFKKSIELNPKHVKAYNNMAWICEREKRWEEGIVMVEKAIELNPLNFIAHNNLGNLCMGMKNNERAERAYQEAIRIKPDFSSALFNLGRVYHIQNRLAEAETYYEKALASNPYQDYAKRFLGDVAFAQGDITKAKRWWTEAIARDPNPAELRQRIAGLP